MGSRTAPAPVCRGRRRFH